MPFSRQSEPLSFLVLCLSVLSLLVRNAYAVGVSITYPAPGASLPAGPITVKWIDAGGNPDMSSLTTYTLQLMVGGNEPGNSKVIATLGTDVSSVADGQISGVIAANISQSTENGFYFRMTSNTTDGNTVINYSNRFTLINMKGQTDSIYLDGANAALGSDNVPAAQYNVITQPATISSAISTTTATATATATATSTTTSSGNKPMATSVKIGIGIGVVFALFGLMSIFIWAALLVRHKRKRRERREALDKERALDGSPGSPRGYEPQTSPAELPTELSPLGTPHEMSANDKPAEAARASIYELDSGWDGWEAMSGRRSRAYDPTNVV